MINQRDQKFLFSCFVYCFFLLFFHSSLGAVGEILIDAVAFKQRTPSKYLVIADVTNGTDESREVIFRAQLTFYDKAAPKGDLPVTIVRKDITIVLRGGETRPLEILLILEGTPPAGSLRIEPSLRIRRQRKWVYV